jgi:hypothetical protein
MMDCGRRSGGFLWEGVSVWRSSEGSLDKLGMKNGREMMDKLRMTFCDGRVGFYASGLQFSEIVRDPSTGSG